MNKPRDPAGVLQRAWSTYRLAQVQAVVHETIAELNGIDAERLLGRGPSDSEVPFAGTPVTEALKACTAELCDECGMPGSPVSRANHCDAVRQTMAHQPAAWAAAFYEALGKYRALACDRLEVRFDPPEGLGADADPDPALAARPVGSMK